ncbi:papain fold toxin domain-containing protein [Pannus brasiliensis CCIBt3594]|uniref:Papain fold toxin domain-containing protein n=1 Tax=Pannus brasiliensis CCIBt3594 TaxID=1427578 RepID=A0AAW9QXB4_9CHRO
MEELSDAWVYQKIGEIVSPFGLYQCEPCAMAVIRWLEENQISGNLLELRTLGYPDEDFILSDRAGNDESITLNGKHYGVEVRGLVFDNLSVEGLSRENWLKDFHCQSGDFVIHIRAGVGSNITWIIHEF